MKIDMHVHTNASHDSPNTLAQIEEYAQSKGLSGVAICNHNIYVEYKSDKIFIIPAAEYSTDAGHILVYFLQSDIAKQLQKNKNGLFFWQDLIDLAHSQGALCFLAHPFAPPKQRPAEFFKYIDGIEVINAKSEYALKADCNKQAQILCKKHALGFCAGSDSHFCGEIGSAYTQFEARDVKDLKQCLANKSCVAVCDNISPFYKPLRQAWFYFKKREFKKSLKCAARLFVAATVIAQKRKRHYTFDQRSNQQ